LAPSARAATGLRAAAASVSDPRLRAALLRLATRHRRGARHEAAANTPGPV